MVQLADCLLHINKYLKELDDNSKLEDFEGYITQVPYCTNFRFHKSDEMVPWKSREDGIIYLRYYHIYRNQELVEEINRLCPLFKILEVEWELGNWVVVLEKEDKDLTTATI